MSKCTICHKTAELVQDWFITVGEIEQGIVRKNMCQDCWNEIDKEMEDFDPFYIEVEEY